MESGEILEISRDVVKPYYQQKARLAREEAVKAFGDAATGDWRIHVTEGALFLWLWFPGLPITAAELYQRLKDRGVLVIPGHYFFFGLPESPDWRHRHECIRVSYAMGEQTVRDGLREIARVVAEVRAS
jgi:valine--pyruvate aminotransferase